MSRQDDKILIEKQKKEIQSLKQFIKDNIDICYRCRDCVAIKQLDLNGNFIKEFKSIKEAAKALNCLSSSIVQVLKGNKETAYGFKWVVTEN